MLAVPARLVAFSIPFVSLELYHGNIHILIAAAIVLGFKHPWTWSFVLLTKPTSGVGLLWFVVRREWRPLFIALGTTAVICLISLVIMPSLWVDYINVLIANTGRMPLSNNIAIPLLDPAAGSRSPRHLGRAHRPPLDGRGVVAHRTAGAVVRGSRDVDRHDHRRTPAPA